MIAELFGKREVEILKLFVGVEEGTKVNMVFSGANFQFRRGVLNR
jgi:hypothetical protein